MAFLWNEQSIAWFLDASAYTGFHEALAARLKPFLPEGGSLCDVGCGLGRIDLALAPHAGEITAVDTDARVINILKGDAEKLGLGNITARVGDAGDISGRYDVIFMSFFGTSGWVVDRFLPMCGQLIRIVNSENRGHLYPEKYRRNKRGTAAMVEADLRQRRIPYRLEQWELEYGQPLRSEKDARAFVRHHAPQISVGELEDFLSRHAQATGRKDFPLYLPNLKRMSIFMMQQTDRQ